MEFDRIFELNAEDCRVQYGTILGEGKIVFIKVGADGSIRGREDKYLKMAERLGRVLGSTVRCAANPCCDDMRADVEAIMRVAADMGASEPEIYLVGISDGGDKALSLAGELRGVVKLLGINPSFVDISDLVEKLSGLPTVEKIFVLGSEDEEYSALSKLADAGIANFRTVTVESANHKFSGMTEKFTRLTDLLSRLDLE